MHSPEILALKSLFVAFNAHDIDAVMQHFNSTAVFETAAGTQPSGTRIMGATGIRNAFLTTFRTMPDCHWNVHWHEPISDNRAVSYWTFSGTDSDGLLSHSDGVDLFGFKQGLITYKSVFRKS